MSAIATQTILHPAVSDSLKVLSTTVGRDKTYRAIQYFSRFLAWYLASRGYNKELVARYAALKSVLGQSRKLMRIGKPLEHMQSAVKATQLSDAALKITAIGRQLGYAVYLVNDMLVWAHSAKVNVLQPDTYARVQHNAARAWLIGITFSLISGAYKTTQLRAKNERLYKSTGSPEKEVERRAELRSIKVQQKAVNRQMLQDSLDWMLPGNTLGFGNLNEGALGLIGFVTSIMGLQSQAANVLGGKAKSA